MQAATFAIADRTDVKGWAQKDNDWVEKAWDGNSTVECRSNSKLTY